MEKKIYFDNNATTKCIQEVLKEMEPYMKEQFADIGTGSFCLLSPFLGIAVPVIFVSFYTIYTT